MFHLIEHQEMMRKLLMLLLAAFGFLNFSLAQETFPRNDVQDLRSGAIAFTNATIMIDYQTVLSDASLMIKDGKIEAVGTNISIPAGYMEIDLKGKYIYPSMIDLHSNYAMPKVERRRGFGGPEQIQSKTKGPYNANEAIKTEFDSYEVFEPDAKKAKSLRAIGFGAVLAFRPDGLARGTSALVTLGDESPNQELIKSKVANHLSFDKGTSNQMYPSSPMGYISLLRQTYMDASWYEAQEPKPYIDATLDAWLENQSLPQIFSASSAFLSSKWQAVLWADKIGDEFGVEYIIKGSGDEYKRIEEIKATEAKMIIPLAFPAPYDVDDPLDAYNVSLANMKHWELAPTNPAALEQAGVEFALTADGLKNTNTFMSNLRKAIAHGLSEETALKALTHVPAKMIGMEDRLGQLKESSIANFIITSGKLFDKGTVIYQNWIQGNLYEVNPMNLLNIAGKYDLEVGNFKYVLEVSGGAGKHKAKIVLNDTTDISVKLKIEDQMVNMSFDPDPSDNNKDEHRLSGWVQGSDLKGSGHLANGDWIDWNASHQGDITSKDRGKGAPQDKSPEVGKVIFPFVAYGSEEIPEQEDILIKNATVWTMDKGILENTDVRIEDGKIKDIGKDLKPKDAKVIDGTGKHLTPGIIDEHSHIGAASINDRATNSSMVRISDVVDDADQEIYRALSGGVTAIQILHGSANPIGGQSALIKLRWGHSPEKLKIENADRFIKFALGENVKRSRSSSSIRYPQTRMGVEQVYMDAFTTAKDYQKKWDDYNGLSSTQKLTAKKPRKDLALEAMSDIINGKLFISCHSYVQSEINMLMNVAEHFDFRVNTFTHILEGYKVADKMAKHGVGGSTFSDWWNYKWEVRYAIPYNATIMLREGVVTAINSDDSEMMRRLNQEAAKSQKYGNLTDEEAMSMVTVNPAKLLHLEERMGMIKKGMDGDVVLWSDHPLSIYARAEKTIVDGTIYFDIERDQKLKEEIALERNRLVQKMKAAKAKGGNMRRAVKTHKHHFHCDDVYVYH